MEYAWHFQYPTGIGIGSIKSGGYRRANVRGVAYFRVFGQTLTCSVWPLALMCRLIVSVTIWRVIRCVSCGRYIAQEFSIHNHNHRLNNRLVWTHYYYYSRTFPILFCFSFGSNISMWTESKRQWKREYTCMLMVAAITKSINYWGTRMQYSRLNIH